MSVINAVEPKTTARPAAKCVVWDLDNTLWRGTLIEGDELELMPEIAEVIVGLDARGILQSIASKNIHDDAWRKLEEFGLAEYFLDPQINWNSKSSSIAEIQRRLNIGIDTFVFVDDQEFERDEVAFSYPEVETIDASAYRELLTMERLSPEYVTQDARQRRKLYLQERIRSSDELAHEGPREEFLRNLNMICDISVATEEDLRRLEELTRRTNQLNSTGIHYSYDDLAELMRDPAYDLWVCGLDDRYGTYGKVGMALVAKDDERWTIKLLLMSCRIVSRGVGTVLLTFVINRAAANDRRLFADFRRTDRNRQMLLTYQLANFEVVSRDGPDTLYENKLEILREQPDYIEVRVNDGK